MNDFWHYLSRASGVVATVLIVAALGGGLLFSARATGRRRRPNWWLDLHNYLGGLAFAFVVVHVVAVYLDRLSGIGVVQIFVPMTATGWAWGITWGVLSTYIFAAVVFTSWPGKRLSRRNWLLVHLLSIPATVMAAGHAWMVGSSRHGLWFQALLATLAGLAVYPAVLRLARVLAKRRKPAPALAVPRPPAPVATPAHGTFRRVEHHMSTAITLGGAGIDDALADQFFAQVRDLEDLLSRYRPHSQVSRIGSGRLAVDDAAPAVREVLARCARLRALTQGDFDHEPRRRTGRPQDPLLDVNALAKGWIIEEAAMALRMTGAEFFVNAGGDVLTTRRAGGRPWRVGVQHPLDRAAVLGTFEVAGAAIATSGTYERGAHIRLSSTPTLTSVTVVGPDLGEADALSTAVFASGQCPPSWWAGVGDEYGVLAVTSDNRLRWIAPRAASEIVWHFPHQASWSEQVADTSQTPS